MENSPEFHSICSEFSLWNWHLEKAFKSWKISLQEHEVEFMNLIEQRKIKIFHLLKSKKAAN